MSLRSSDAMASPRLGSLIQIRLPWTRQPPLSVLAALTVTRIRSLRIRQLPSTALVLIEPDSIESNNSLIRGHRLRYTANPIDRIRQLLTPAPALSPHRTRSSRMRQPSLARARSRSNRSSRILRRPAFATYARTRIRSSRIRRPPLFVLGSVARIRTRTRSRSRTPSTPSTTFLRAQTFRRIRSLRTRRLDRTKTLVLDAFQQLRRFHQAGYVHGDIKMDNFLVREGKVVVADVEGEWQ